PLLLRTTHHALPATTPPAATALIPNAPATTTTCTLSLHDALPISTSSPAIPLNEYRSAKKLVPRMGEVQSVVASAPALTSPAPSSDEHTSQLQSHLNVVCRVLL